MTPAERLAAAFAGMKGGEARAIAIAVEIRCLPDISPLERATAHLLHGRAAYHLGRMGESGQQLELALDLAGELRDPELIGQAGCYLATLHAQTGESAQAMDAAHEVLRICETAQWRAEAHTALGWLHQHLGDRERCMHHLEQACTEWSRMGGYREAIGWSNMVLALTLDHDDQGRMRRAAECSARAEAIFAELKPDARARPVNLGNWGEVLFALGQIEPGRERFHEALALQREQVEDLNLTQCLLSFGHALRGAGLHCEAIPHLREALELVRAQESPRLERDTLESLAQACAGQGDYQRAYEASQAAGALTRTLLSGERNTRIAELNSRFENELARVRNEELAAANEQLGTVNRRLAGANAALEASNRALTDANAQSEELARARSEFLWVISHEIRTPLNGVVGVTGLLERTELDGAQRELVDIIRSSGELTLAVINDVLDFGRLDAGRVELEVEEVDTAELVRDTTRLIVDGAESRGLAFVVEAQEGAPACFQGDPRRLGQVLLNLLSNAMKFTESGEVRVRVGVGERALRIEVRDTGVGISTAACERLFEPFEQARASTAREYGGSGLGLAIARHIVQLHGGEIGAEPLERGSCFWVELPWDSGATIGPFEVDLSAGERIPRRPVDAQPLMGRGPEAGMRVMACDDDPVNQFVLRRMLQALQVEGEVVGSGEELLAHPQVQECDLLILDIQMRGISGIETARRLREDGYRGPMVALSAGTSERVKEEAFDAGMDDYLVKPMSLDGLRLALQRWRASPAA